MKQKKAPRLQVARTQIGGLLFLTADEVANLADAIDPRYRALIYTAAYTGLRASELLALTRADVDLLRGQTGQRADAARVCSL